MAAVAPLRATPAPARRPGRRPPLRLVPPLRARRSRPYGDAVFAATLSALLVVGIIGVLLLNTAMQTQADRIAALQHRLSALALQVQAAQTASDRDSSPSALAARAAALDMRPAGRMPILRAARTTPQRLPGSRKVSARARAAKTTRGG